MRTRGAGQHGLGQTPASCVCHTYHVPWRPRSPASFDPLLEHFLRAVEPSAGTCACLFERGEGGKVVRMVLEEGNIPLMQARPLLLQPMG